MRYLIIPELHKSGRIHFHGVFSDVKNWSLSPAINPYTGESIIENNKQVYNLDNYKLGYTTVSKVENIEAVSHYISKNIDYKSEKVQESYEKRYYSVSSYNIYYVNFPLLSLFFF